MVRSLLLAAGLLVLSATGPCAENDREEIRRMLISSCKTWDTCGFHRRTYAPRYYELRSFRHDEDVSWREDRWRWSWNPRDERRPVERAQREWERYTTTDPSFRRYRQCHDRIIEVLSDQHKSEERAMSDAWVKWIANVQFERGALWQDPQNSIQRWSVCAATDISDTVTGAVSRFGGKVYAAARRAVGKDDVRDDGRNLRCRLWARACPVIPEPAEPVDEDRGRTKARR